jgi:flagellar motor switch/type III secretory pathway protein FliN
MLTAGASINISRLPEGLVNVMCNGQALARGRVVHVEGGIGVKIET